MDLFSFVLGIIFFSFLWSFVYLYKIKTEIQTFESKFSMIESKFSSELDEIDKKIEDLRRDINDTKTRVELKKSSTRQQLND